MTRKRKLVSLILLGIAWLSYQNCIGPGSSSGTSGSFTDPSHTNSTNVGNPFSTIAALPKTFLNSSYPQVTGKTLTVGNGKQYTNCQSAIDAAQPGDEVVIDARFNCSPIILRDKGATDSFIVIRSSKYSSLPPEGTRVSATDATNMAVVTSYGGNPAVGFDPGANHYYVTGVEVTASTGVADFKHPLVQFNATDPTNLPHDIVMARAYVHGHDGQNVPVGIAFNGSAVSVVDSLINNIHASGIQGAAVKTWVLGYGPFKIVNNELVSTGPCFSSGDDGTTFTGMIPSDIEFRHNYVHKDLSVLQLNPNPYGLGPLVSLKNVQRILFTGNLFEFALNQPAILFAPNSYSGAEPWVRVQDINFVNNIVRNAPGAFSIVYQDPNFSGAVVQRVQIQNNLIYNIDPQWGTLPGLISLTGPAQGPVVFNHNTMLDIAGSGPALVNASGGISQFTFENNMTNDEGKGVYDAAYGTGTSTLDNEFPSVLFKGNALTGQASTNYMNYNSANFFPPSLSSVGFVIDPTNGVTDWHSLGLSATSPYHAAATDGTDIGVDITSLGQAAN